MGSNFNWEGWGRRCKSPPAQTTHNFPFPSPLMLKRQFVSFSDKDLLEKELNRILMTLNTQTEYIDK